MNNRIKAYIFDVDGTILKSDGKTLQKGIPQIMKKIYNTRMPVLFVSGKNYAEVFDVVDKICKEAHISRDMFDVSIASNSGGYIDRFYETNSITNDQLKKIKQTVQTIDSGAVLVYKTKNKNYIERARDSKSVISKIKKASVITLTNIFIKANKLDLPIQNTNKFGMETLEKSNVVLSLNILSLKKSEQITQQLSLVVPELSFVANENYVEVSVNNKHDVVKHFLNQYDNTIRQKHVVYFGDNNNDEKAIMACGLGFLCNLKPKLYDLFKRVTNYPDKYAIDDFADPDVIKAVTGGEYSESKLKALTKQVEERLKKPKENKNETKKNFELSFAR